MRYGRKRFDPNTRYKRDVEGWFGHIDYLQRYIRYDFDEQWHIGRWHSTARDGNPGIGQQALRDALSRRLRAFIEQRLQAKLV